MVYIVQATERNTDGHGALTVLAGATGATSTNAAHTRSFRRLRWRSSTFPPIASLTSSMKADRPGSTSLPVAAHCRLPDGEQRILAQSLTPPRHMKLQLGIAAGEHVHHGEHGADGDL